MTGRRREAAEDPLHLMREEHRSVMRELKGILEKLEGSSAQDLAGRLSKFLRLLSLHLKREERLYSLLKLSWSDGKGLVEEMLKEHRRIARILGALDILWKRGDLGPLQELRGRLEELKALLLEHFGNEEDVVFWMAEVKLTRKEWLSLALRMRGTDE